MAKRNVAAIGAVVLATLCGLLGLSPASAASGATQGVTATTISVGVPFVDVAAVKSVGVTINWGSVPDAFKSVINDYNSHGGVNGRKIVPYIIPVDPTSAAPAATACTQLTQDDHVFAAIGPLMPDCYLQHGVPVIAAVLTGTATGSVPDFGLAPPATAYDPLQLSIFQKHGVFKNKKVGVLAGVTTDEQELGIVQSELRKLHVNVVQTAVDSAPQGDLDAEFQQIAVITQKFQSAGVNEV
ncbi:MAG: hypothetical protein ACRDYB_16645, partial [Acidimicrobiales bacterium]